VLRVIPVHKGLLALREIQVLLELQDHREQLGIQDLLVGQDLGE
jgi:hypothetical protein